MASAVMSLLPHLLSIVHQKAIKEIMHQRTGAFPLRRKSNPLLSSSEIKRFTFPRRKYTSTFLLHKMSHGAFSTRKQAAETNVLAAIFLYKYLPFFSHLYLTQSIILSYPLTYTHTDIPIINSQQQPPTTFVPFPLYYIRNSLNKISSTTNPPLQQGIKVKSTSGRSRGYTSSLWPCLLDWF
jgi:hypothetical protein